MEGTTCRVQRDASPLHILPILPSLKDSSNHLTRSLSRNFVSIKGKGYTLLNRDGLFPLLNLHAVFYTKERKETTCE